VLKHQPFAAVGGKVRRADFADIGFSIFAIAASPCHPKAMVSAAQRSAFSVSGHSLPRKTVKFQ
jgi:hypothetical protein